MADEPMEHSYDESPFCQQVRDINVNCPQPYTTTSTSINTSKFITEEAKRFAQSRYPYSPITLLFKSSKINDKMIINELINYCKENYSFGLDLAGFQAFDGATFSIERQPVIPPQLVVVISNVSYTTNILEFEKDIKTRYNNIVKVVRLKNKNQYDTKFVKLEFNSSKVRDEILAKGYMMINYLKYAVKEYLPQASILICSNSMGLWHFRKQCKQTSTTCKVCSEQFKDTVNHQCQGVVKCLHCDGVHYSNDLKCKVIKQFRADLTSSLLSSASK
ncbi:unnamed protein product [Rotaria sp. Silwood2]|nr:unnamed protein product [Rotaria sp. Silwood2]